MSIIPLLFCPQEFGSTEKPQINQMAQIPLVQV